MSPVFLYLILEKHVIKIKVVAVHYVDLFEKALKESEEELEEIRACKSESGTAYCKFKSRAVCLSESYYIRVPKYGEHGLP